MSFKLIAIRQLESDNKKFTKNLQTQFYEFTDSYDFSNFPDKIKIVEDSSSNNVPDLYSQTIEDDLHRNKKLKINISAIVGKNGSGKSSLIELLYIAFYKIARITDIINLSSENIEKKIKKDELSLSAQLRETAKIIEDKIANQLTDPLIDEYLKHKYSTLMYSIHEILEEEQVVDYDENTHNLNIEILYEIDSVIYSLKVNDFTCFLNEYKVDEDDDKFLIIDNTHLVTDKEYFKKISNLFFYNLVINYSIYGLNSEESGLWIEKLFHKNDSYQTPIVLNPYRDKGKIDINSENYLVRSRLLALILAKDVNSKTISEGKEVKRIKLTYIEKSLPDTIVYLDKFKSQFFPKLLTYFFWNYDDGKMPDLDDINLKIIEFKQGNLNEKILKYILKKIDNIVDRYPTFKKYAPIKDDEIFNSDFENDLIKDLWKDRSHISLKVKQALNFYHYQNYLDDKILETEKIFPISELKNEVNSYHSQNDFVDLIEYIPPSFFKIELYFDELNDENNFSNLSSGEKQKIYSLNSIVYHLRNLLSVNRNHNNQDLIVYSNFNIILDEIELYYHPELQRTFIFDLIEYIRKIDFENRYFDCIPNINIIFITHSPFILSDIPKQNILFLDVDEETNKSKPQIYKEDNTFAGNVHEMLTNGFFLESTKGKFAIFKINEFLEFYKKNNEITKIEFNLKKKNFKNLILLVGEEYLRKILLNQFDELDQKFNSNYLEEKQNELEKELESIKNQRRTEENKK